jgi:hypothetical protein
MLTVTHYLQTRGNKKEKGGKITTSKQHDICKYLTFYIFYKKKLFGVSTNSKTKNQMKDSKLNLLKLIIKIRKEN